MVVGGLFAVGGGVAGTALIVDGATTGDGSRLGEGAAIAAMGACGLALATYGVVTYALVQGSPFREPLPLPHPTPASR
jgi:hypothetical protein